jgi:hypothetical protein
VQINRAGIRDPHATLESRRFSNPAWLLVPGRRPAIEQPTIEANAEAHPNIRADQVLASRDDQDNVPATPHSSITQSHWKARRACASNRQ